MEDCALTNATVFCPRELSCEDGFGTLVMSPRAAIISIFSCVLSCLGSLLIIFSYWRWKDIRTGSRSVITFLAIADFFTAFGYIIGSSNYIAYYGDYENTLRCAKFQEICEIQSYITTWSSLSSFAWTCALAIYLYFTVVRKRIALALKIIPFFHVIAWGVPIAICLPLLIRGKLGYSPFAVSTWCFIGSAMESSKLDAETIGLIFLAGKGFEIFTYILVVVLYIVIKCHIWKETREAKKDHVLSQTMAAAVQGVDRKLTFIPVMFILLRMWGTLQFFYGLIISKHIQCGCVHKDLRAGFVFFGYMHAIGDGGQGWGNAILYIFASTKIRDRMFGWLYKPILGAILHCLRGYEDAVPEEEANVNGPLIRPGFQRVEMQQGEETINPDLQVSLESQSVLYKPRSGRKHAGVVDHEPTTEFTTQFPE